jgi:hypothetical protein
LVFCDFDCSEITGSNLAYEPGLNHTSITVFCHGDDSGVDGGVQNDRVGQAETAGPPPAVSRYEMCLLCSEELLGVQNTAVCDCTPALEFDLFEQHHLQEFTFLGGKRPKSILDLHG